MHIGLPPMLTAAPELSSIRTLLSENRVPKDFSSQVRVQLVAASFANLISNGSDHVLDTSLIQLLDDQLGELGIRFPDGWTAMTEFSALVTKLHFYATVTARARPTTPSCGVLLRLGFSASLRIVHMANARVNDTSTAAYNLTASQHQRTLPKNYFRGLAFASVFLLKYFSMNNSAKNEERQLAADHVAIAHGIFRLCATKAKDEYGRVADLLDTLRRQRPTEDEGARPRRTDRMGVSLVLDAISTAAEVRGESAEISESTATTGNEVRGDDASGKDLNFTELESQTPDPWPSDLAVVNGFWNDPMWDVFNFESEALYQ